MGLETVLLRFCVVGGGGGAGLRGASLERDCFRDDEMPDGEDVGEL